MSCSSDFGNMSAGSEESLTVMLRSLTMFVVGNKTPFRQKEKGGLVLCFLLISKIQHFSTDNCNCHVLAHSQCTLMQN